MRETHLGAIDLNLLVALDALLRERSVTRAAARVGLSQPAMSRALGRLRVLFDDPLLVRSGHAMVPTPRALAAAPSLRQSLDAALRTLEPESRFEPRTARRSFVVAAVDTTQALVLPRLLEHIAEQAPGIEVSTRPLPSASATFDALSAGEWPLAIGRFEAPPKGIRRALLYRDSMVCVVRKQHPRIRRRLSLKRYLEESHLAALPIESSDGPFSIESLLAERGLARRVVCTVESLAVAPLVVSQTDLICSAPARTIVPFAAGLGVRILRPPFETPEFDLHIVWHERNERDAGHAWLRQTMIGLFED